MWWSPASCARNACAAKTAVRCVSACFRLVPCLLVAAHRSNGAGLYIIIKEGKEWWGERKWIKKERQRRRKHPLCCVLSFQWRVYHTHTNTPINTYKQTLIQKLFLFFNCKSHKFEGLLLSGVYHKWWDTQIEKNYHNTI